MDAFDRYSTTGDEISSTEPQSPPAIKYTSAEELKTMTREQLVARIEDLEQSLEAFVNTLGEMAVELDNMMHERDAARQWIELCHYSERAMQGETK